MNTFAHDDGQGSLYNDEGIAVTIVEMEPEEKATRQSATRDGKQEEDTRAPDIRKHYKDLEKEQLFTLIYEKGMSARAAVIKLHINPRTAQRWFKNDQENPQTCIARKEGSGRPAGRPALLDDSHKKFIVDLVDDQPSLVLDQMMESLTASFIELEISKTALYNFVTKNCNISLKRAHFHSVDRNSLRKIKERREWVEKWMDTNIDYMNNCVFIDEAAFYINMKRTFAWSKVGTKAVFKVPKTRAKTTAILGATSAQGVVDIKVRRPRVLPSSKKRKTAGSSGSSQKQSRGTVTGHYFNFLNDTMDVMDKFPDVFKDNYLIMDNTPIHINEDIKSVIEGRGYRCVYLPPYSPELNPIEQFWSVCKSKLKRERPLEEETLSSRIADACNQILLNDLKGFCKYSIDGFDDCLQEKPL
ncbi:conserved hypothetical protein [Mucor ambiguus]|uniref:Tc1-like transposase DDE domain-containing protein n=1 Tax=Mucor ambiguus TaxID=91626 RepID=A0A0C9MHG6_9FUNG|nr:conserved hypothetical protein [Mucor ambiguus]